MNYNIMYPGNLIFSFFFFFLCFPKCYTSALEADLLYLYPCHTTVQKACLHPLFFFFFAFCERKLIFNER